MSDKTRPNQPSSAAKMYSGQLVDRLVHTGGAEPVLMRDFLKATLSLVEEGLMRDGFVKIHNFGTFRLRWTQQREGVNPRTGEKMIVSGRARVIFQPAKSLRELVNLNYQPSLPPLATEAAATTVLPFEEPLAVEPPPTKPMLPALASDHSLPEEIEAGELIPETVAQKTPTFVFADPEAEERPEPTSAFSLTPYERERLKIKNEQQRKPSRGFAWFAGALALLLLLLFLFADRIFEMKAPTSPPVASTTPPSTSEPAQETHPATNDAKPPTDGQTKLTNGAAKASTATAPFFSGGTHQVVAGDNLWDLSGNYYRDHYLWPNIYRVNNASISNPDILEIEQQLAVPVLYGPPEKLTPTDRRNLAEGYYLLYRYYKNAESHLAPYALWAAVQYDKRIKSDYHSELREDDLVFLEAHGIRRAVAER
jgi:nucleoid DNA-binding protein